MRCAGLSAEKNDDRVSFCRNEAEEEDVAAAAVVTLEDRLSQRTVLVKGHLLVLGPD